jgi:hypothetical protein
MNLKEYEKKLRDLTHEELQKFNADFGGERTEIDQRVRDFVDHPEHEGRICQLLGLKTEAEKLTDAAINSANAAMQSATSARLSMIWSVVACLATITAVVVAIITLFLKG